MTEQKAEVAVDSLSDAEACDFFRLFGFEPEGAQRLYGGYASSNFKVVGRRVSGGESTSFLLKINYYGLSVEDGQYQLTVMEHLRSFGFPTNYPHKAADGQMLIESKGRRCMLLDFISGGVPGSKLLERGEEVACSLLRQLSEVLAQLHQVAWPEVTPPFRDIRSGYPVCNTGDLLKGEETAKLKADPKFAEHPVITFAVEHEAWLRELYARDLPWGVIHGDGFPDNTLFSDDGGEHRLLALIDWEDSCVAPLVLDLAVSISACCFDGSNNLLRERLVVMLQAYSQRRKLSAIERESLVDFMMAGAFACAFYRFCEFNVRQPDCDEKAKGSFQLMLGRARLLESGPAREVVLAAAAEL